MTPSLRFATTTPTLVASSVSILPTRTKTRQAAEKRNVSASRQNAQSMLNAVASRPDRAKPIEVEPNELIMIQEFAAASSSSVATSGRSASLAGLKNCEIVLTAATATYSKAMSTEIRNGIVTTITARRRSEMTMILRRS